MFAARYPSPFLDLSVVSNWKHFAVVNDDLIAKFLNVIIALLGLWVAMVKRLSFGKMYIHYFLCAGKNPNEINEKNGRQMMNSKFNTTQIVVCISAVFLVFVSTNISVPTEIGKTDTKDKAWFDRSIAMQQR